MNEHVPFFYGPVSQDYLQSLFNSVLEGVIALDKANKVVAINDSALRILGIARHNALGGNCSDIFHSDLCGKQCNECPLWTTGKPLQSVATSLTNAMGNVVPIQLSSNEVLDPEGQVIGGVVSFTAQDQTQQEHTAMMGGLPFQNIITGDPAMRQIFSILPTIASSDTSVLINGDTGTGKNLVAKAIHDLSPRSRGPMITVNCAALPESLLEAELFGHKAGAFTGAVRDRPGRFAAAEGGTLFLDEIGDIPLGVQVKLLRVLQERYFERVGEQKPIPCNIRLITATHKNLANMIADGSFRRDLYYRVNVLNIDLPPLSERKGDIPLLAQKFIHKFSQTRGKAILGLNSSALELLMSHDFPGNVRELENIIEHGWVMCKGQVIGPENLPKRLKLSQPPSGNCEGTALSQLESTYLIQVLTRNNWHRNKTAKELGIHRTTLQRKINKLGIRPPRRDGRRAQ